MLSLIQINHFSSPLVYQLIHGLQGEQPSLLSFAIYLVSIVEKIIIDRQPPNSIV